MADVTMVHRALLELTFVTADGVATTKRLVSPSVDIPFPRGGRVLLAWVDTQRIYAKASQGWGAFDIDRGETRQTVTYEPSHNNPMSEEEVATALLAKGWTVFNYGYVPACGDVSPLGTAPGRCTLASGHEGYHHQIASDGGNESWE